jgi:hypothetical protein
MKVLYVGELESTDVVTTSKMRMLAIQDLGCEVKSIDARSYYVWGGKPGGVFRRLKWGPPLRWLNREVLRQAEASRPEVVWIDKGIWIYPQTLKTLQSRYKAILVHYTPDPIFCINGSRHLIRSFPHYDVFVTTKAYEVDRCRKFGARNILFQYPTFDRRVHKPETPTVEDATRFGTDVVFVGSYAPGREKYLAPLAAAGFRLAIWGSFWDRCNDRQLQPHIRRRPVSGRDYALALSCAKIGLGLLSPLWPDRSTTRSLEIPASGCFLLAERTDEHQKLFTEGKEAEYFSTREELIEKARYYLTHDEDRKRIAAAGRQRCLSSGYSSDDRVREIVTEVHRIMRLRHNIPTVSDPASAL